MDTLAQYIFRVCGAGIICAVLRYMTKSTGYCGICRHITSAFLFFVLLYPFGNFSLREISEFLPEVDLEVDTAVAQGKDSYQNALAQSISQRTEAYILEKGAQYGVSLSVQVELSKDALPVPIRVRLKGNVSPYAKSRLQNILTSELGIPKEDQIWT